MKIGSRRVEHDRLSIIAFLLAGLIGVIVYVALYDAAFPTASLNLKVTRTDALRIGERFLQSQGYRLKGYQRVVTFDYDSHAKEFLERNVGLRTANKLMAGKLKVWNWQVRWFKPMQEEEFSVSVDPSGAIVGFDHTIPEKEKGARLTRTSAREIAAGCLRSRGLDMASYKLVEDSSQKRPNRMDHYFTWEVRGFKVKKATSRVYVQVAGDRVGNFGYFLKTPEDWDRKLETEGGQGEFLMHVAEILHSIFSLASFVVFLFAVRSRSIRWRFIVLLAGILAIVEALAAINSLPMAKAYQSTTETMGSFTASQILGIIMGSVGTALSLFIVAAAADVMYRRAFPSGAPISQLLTRPGLISRQFVRGSLVGFGMGLAQLGFVAAFYVIAMKYFHAWSPAEVPYDDTLSTAIPWIYPLTIGLSASLFEEFRFRLFAVSFVKRYARLTVLAVVLPAMIWAFLHSNYPQHPAYVRGIELSIVGTALGLVFLRYGVVATMVAHYTYNAVVSGMLLIRSDNIYYKLSGLAVMLLMLLPLIPAAIRVMRRPADEDEFVVQPGIEPAPAPSPPRVEEPPEPPRMHVPASRRRLIIIAAIGLAIAPLLFILDPKGLDLPEDMATCVNRKTAAALAEKAIHRQGADTRGFMRYVEFWDSSGGLAEDYLVRHTKPETAEKWMTRELHDATWHACWFKPMQKERYEVWLNPDGSFYTWDHTIKEDATGARLSADQARAAAERVLASQGVKFADYVLVDSSADRREHRTDHSYTWEKKSPKVAGASFRLDAYVQGDAVMSRSDYVKIPDEYYREQEKRTTRMSVCAGVLGLVMFVLSTLIFILFVQQFAARRINWRLAFVWTIPFAVAQVLNHVNGLPTLLSGYSDTDPMQRFIWTEVLTALFALVGGVISAACFIGFADALYRRAFPDRPSFADWFGRKADTGWRRRAFRQGVFSAVAVIPPSALVYYLADKAQEWLFADLVTADTGRYATSLNGLTPVLDSFAMLPYIALMAPLAIALIASLARIYSRKRWLIALVVLVPLLGVGASAKTWSEFAQQILGVGIGVPLFIIVTKYWFDHNAYAYAYACAMSAFVAEGFNLSAASDAALKWNGIALIVLGALPILIALYTWLSDRRPHVSVEPTGAEFVPGEVSSEVPHNAM